MNWIALVSLAVFFDSLQLFISNYIADTYFKKRGAVSQKIYSSVLALTIAIIILIITNFSFKTANLTSIELIILSGIFTVIDGIPYMRALEIDDSTNMGIFVQLTPLLYLIIGWLFLNEPFSPKQLIPFIFILAAPILIVLTTRKKSRHTKLRAILCAFLYVLLSAIGNLIFVESSNNIMFVQSMSFLFIGKFIGTAIIIFPQKKWRKRLSSTIKESKYKVLRPITVNFFVSIVKDFCYRGALIIAPTVAIASASSDAVEPVVIFFMGIILTLIWPKFGREKLNRKTVIVHFISIILVVIGIILLNML